MPPENTIGSRVRTTGGKKEPRRQASGFHEGRTAIVMEALGILPNVWQVYRCLSKCIGVSNALQQPRREFRLSGDCNLPAAGIRRSNRIAAPDLDAPEFRIAEDAKVATETNSSRMRATQRRRPGRRSNAKCGAMGWFPDYQQPGSP